jgi:hypothetical protein
MIHIFHGNDEKIHNAFQAWRQANVDGFQMTEKSKGKFVIHYAQDKRENSKGRGCVHQGCSFIEYREEKRGCYTTAKKVCSNSFADLIGWARIEGYSTRNCKHCDTNRFPLERKKMSKINVSEWHVFYKRLTKFPWDRVAYLVSNEADHADLGRLVARYERLKAEADLQLPHGPGLFKRLDTLFKRL